MSRSLFIIPAALLLSLAACKKQEAPSSPPATPSAPSPSTTAPAAPATPPAPPPSAETPPAAPATPPAAAPGSAPPPAAASAGAPGAGTGGTASVGQDVFNKTCVVCHGAGVGGAPMLTNATEWNARRAKGKDALYTSAINGYIGTKGAMPARGANPNLSDAEVKAAVDYMLATAAK